MSFRKVSMEAKVENQINAGYGGTKYQVMKLPAASSGVSVYRRIQQAFTASGGEFNPERLTSPKTASPV